MDYLSECVALYILLIRWDREFVLSMELFNAFEDPFTTDLLEVF
jgi:hypothetical protein